MAIPVIVPVVQQVQQVLLMLKVLLTTVAMKMLVDYHPLHH